MFTVLNSESLWIGTDLKKRFNEIRDILDSIVRISSISTK